MMILGKVIFVGNEKILGFGHFLDGINLLRGQVMDLPYFSETTPADWKQKFKMIPPQEVSLLRVNFYFGLFWRAKVYFELWGWILMAWCALSNCAGGDQVFRLLKGTDLCFL